MPTLFVEIRKRLGKKRAMQLNDAVLLQAKRLGAIAHQAKPGVGAEAQPPAAEEGGTDAGARPAGPCAAEGLPGGHALPGEGVATNDAGQEEP